MLAWFLLACININNKGIWQAEKRGEITDQRVIPPSWLGFLILPQYLMLLLVFLIDMDFIRVAVMWIATFVVDVVARPILGFIGAILVTPVMMLKNLKAKDSDNFS